MTGGGGGGIQKGKMRLNTHPGPMALIEVGLCGVLYGARGNKAGKSIDPPSTDPQVNKDKEPLSER